jgi:hypothetical protein
MLCAHHHAGVHAGIWSLTIINGLPWIIPPRWVTPDRRPVRNPVPDARAHAEHLARQLRLAIPDQPHHDDS